MALVARGARPYVRGYFTVIIAGLAFRMTRDAIEFGWCARIGVTCSATDTRMRARSNRERMVECRAFPTGRVVAGLAVRPESGQGMIRVGRLLVVLQVTRRAIRAQSGVHAAFVTVAATCRRVRAG
jgi:hypothetical protein